MPMHRPVPSGLASPLLACTRPFTKDLAAISRRAKDEFPSISGVTTLYESLERSVKMNPSSPALGYRPIVTDGKAGDYEWITYSELESERPSSQGQPRVFALCLLLRRALPVCSTFCQASCSACPLRRGPHHMFCSKRKPVSLLHAYLAEQAR